MSDTLFSNETNILDHTFRAYETDLDMKQVSLFQAANAAAISPRALQVSVPPGLCHRKIWSLVYTLDASGIVNWDMVFTLNGQEVLRFAAAKWITALTPQFNLGYGIKTNIQGGFGEQLTVKYDAGNFAGFPNYTLRVTPLLFNIQCDTIFIDSRKSTGSGVAKWDMYLFVMSQTGV